MTALIELLVFSVVFALVIGAVFAFREIVKRQERDDDYYNGDWEN